MSLERPEFTPRSKHPSLYPYVFGDVLHEAQSVLDVGAGDNDYYETARKLGQNFTRIDAQYSRVPPKGDQALAAEVTQLPFPDNSFDVVVSSLVFQHIPGENTLAALQEMSRVLRPGVANQYNVGSMLIYPVWKPQNLSDVIAKYSKTGMIDMGYTSEHNQWILEGRGGTYDHQTLLLRKTVNSDPHTYQKMLEAISESGALRKNGVSNKITKYLLSIGILKDTRRNI